MPSDTMIQEGIFAYPEFLAMLSIVGARAVVGIDSQELFPATERELNILLQQGEALLQQRGMLTFDDEHQPTLDPALRRTITTVAYPEIAIPIIRQVRGEGRQLFLLYLAHGTAVEQTLPNERLHRLAILPDFLTVLARIKAILALRDTPIEPISFKMSEQTFLQLRDLRLQKRYDQQRTLLRQAGISEQEAHRFNRVLDNLTFEGKIAVLRCTNEAITDARDILILQDDQSAWRAVQSPPDALIYQWQPTNATELEQLILRQVETLSGTRA